MAHESDTQASSEDMPRVAHTIQRNGVYYFNFRYPDALVKAGLVKSHKKFSLKTRDWREAKSKAIRAAADCQAGIERLKLQLEGGSDLHVRAKGRGHLVPFSSVAPDDRADLIARAFVEFERREESSREAFRESSDVEFRQFCLTEARSDWGVLSGMEVQEVFDWDGSVLEFLKSQGYCAELRDIDNRFRQLYKRAIIEAHWRTMETYNGHDFRTKDPHFAKLHSETRLTEKQGSAQTISEICRRYPTRKREGKLSQATLVCETAEGRLSNHQRHPQLCG